MNFQSRLQTQQNKESLVRRIILIEIVNNENLDGYYIVRNDDFIYNPRISATAPVGPINRNRLGRNGVMSPLYTVFRTHDIDNLYLEFYFKTTKWHRFMKLNEEIQVLGLTDLRFHQHSLWKCQFRIRH